MDDVFAFHRNYAGKYHSCHGETTKRDWNDQKVAYSSNSRLPHLKTQPRYLEKMKVGEYRCNYVQKLYD
ncbi:MAG: hypothetical protein EZS28_014102 [Streblomastix strix]|uniref:Uncharacterized protein n=1 Tax=Streblomastix strix TaxID=222440 RepID=A0A5J4W6M5_9EUKA|nr:MAG: hypothetical protein EZS28_014102 [Streblomastix strix]